MEWNGMALVCVVEMLLLWFRLCEASEALLL
jgi:hypothetical protein